MGQRVLRDHPAMGVTKGRCWPGMRFIPCETAPPRLCWVPERNGAGLLALTGSNAGSHGLEVTCARPERPAQTPARRYAGMLKIRPCCLRRAPPHGHTQGTRHWHDLVTTRALELFARQRLLARRVAPATDHNTVFICAPRRTARIVTHDDAMQLDPHFLGSVAFPDLSDYRN